MTAIIFSFLAELNPSMNILVKFTAVKLHYSIKQPCMIPNLVT